MVRGMQVLTSESGPVCIYLAGAEGQPLVGKKQDNRLIGLGQRGRKQKRETWSGNLIRSKVQRVMPVAEDVSPTMPAPGDDLKRSTNWMTLSRGQ